MKTTQVHIDYRIPYRLALPVWMEDELSARISWAANPLYNGLRPTKEIGTLYQPDHIHVRTWASVNDVAHREERLVHHRDVDSDDCTLYLYVYYAINDSVGGFVKRDPFTGRLCTGGSFQTDWPAYFSRNAWTPEDGQ